MYYEKACKDCAMAITNSLSFNLSKRKKQTAAILLFSLCVIVGSDIIFLLYITFAKQLVHVSFIAEIILLLLLNIVVMSAVFFVGYKVVQRRDMYIAGSLMNILKQYEKGNYTYTFSIDNSYFDDVLKYILKLTKRQNKASLSYNEQLNENAFEVITALISAMEDKDPYTSGHSARVAQYALAIGKRLGLSKEQMRLLNHAAAAHDIGKIGIPIEIIEKNGKLDDKERLMMESHPIRGMKILSSIDYMEDIAFIVMYHHERIDGLGYYHLFGDRIPLLSKILAVADAVDAMLSDRPYKRALSIQEVKHELGKNKGTQFDAEVVDAFIGVLEENEPLRKLIVF